VTAVDVAVPKQSGIVSVASMITSYSRLAIWRRPWFKIREREGEVRGGVPRTE
jgi:hypothetical protein